MKPPRVRRPSDQDLDASIAALLDWYGDSRRPLPWRRTSDPYSVLVSEVMLQQTTVKAVIPYYERFMERFPDWASLASASEDMALSYWSGLGYYSRCRNLRRTAIEVLQTEAGLFPRDPKRVRELPGIGDYTAGAVLSIAYGLPEPAIDGNVTRVLTRLRGLRGDPKKSALRDKLREIAASMIPVDRPGDFNQALMELGARVCLPSQPRCGECPLERHCEAHRIGIASSLPETAPRAAMIDVPTAAAWIERNGRVLLHRRSASEVLGGLWEFPGLLQTDLAASLPARSNGRAHRTGISRTTARRLMKFLASHLGLKLDHLGEIASVRHVVTFRRIQITLFQGELTGPVRRNDLRWVHHDELARLPQSALTRKLHARALALRAGEIADDKA